LLLSCADVLWIGIIYSMTSSWIHNLCDYIKACHGVGSLRILRLVYFHLNCYWTNQWTFILFKNSRKSSDSTDSINWQYFVLGSVFIPLSAIRHVKHVFMWLPYGIACYWPQSSAWSMDTRKRRCLKKPLRPISSQLTRIILTITSLTKSEFLWFSFNPFRPYVHYNGHHMSAPFFNFWSISPSLKPAVHEIGHLSSNQMPVKLCM